MTRVLEPGGVVIIAVQNIPAQTNATHIVQGVLKDEKRVQRLSQFDELFKELDRIAGFETKTANLNSQTMAAYIKPLNS